MGLGTTDFSCFLKLPKLERLNIRKAAVFSDQNLDEFKTFEKLTRFEFSFFQMDETSEFHGLLKAVEMMPALKYLSVTGLPDYIVPAFTCNVIKKYVAKKDIVVAPWRGYNIMRVYKNNQRTRTERLTMWVRPQDEEFVEIVSSFVKKLKGYSFIVGESKDVGDLFDDDNSEEKIMKTCCNVFNVSDGSDSETEEDEKMEQDSGDDEDDESDDSSEDEEDDEDNEDDEDEDEVEMENP